MNVIIAPTKLIGNVIVPPSKSLSHRAIIAASLAVGKSIISNIIYSDDVKATINAMRACGANITEFSDYLEIEGCDSRVKRRSDIIDACESGSTIRFMIPIALINPKEITFVGKNNLVKRPLNVFTDIFDEQGIEYEKGTDSLPLKVKGKLSPGVYNLRGDISSQFISGLLFALPLLNDDSKIVMTTKLESKGYIDLTIDILKKYNIEIINNNYESFEIRGNQEYMPYDYTVEGDYSQSSYFLVAGALGANLNLLHMNKNSFQGDKKIIQDIEALGGKCQYEKGILKSYPVTPVGATIDFSQSPDLGPALCVLAALCDGESHFINVKRLRIKECDRVEAMQTELNKMGANITSTENEMIIKGVNTLHGCLDLDSHNDHRVVMALAIASIVCDTPIRIKNAEAINKSFPHFFKILEGIGGVIQYEE